MFSRVDAIHFNSQNTAGVYGKYVDIPEESAVVAITHNGIKDWRNIRLYDENVLRLGFIGSETPYKGLPMLRKIIGRLNSEGFKEKMRLYVHGGRIGVDGEFKNIAYKGKFTSSQMLSIYESMDLLVVPSICYETFSLTTLEALQFGVPILVSSTVGAKDIIKKYAPQFVFETPDDLYEILKRLLKNRKELIEYNQKIVDSSWQWSLSQHAKNIEDIIYRKSNLLEESHL